MSSGYLQAQGCRYNEFDFKKMEAAPEPELTLTAEEVFMLQEDNGAGEEFDSIEEAESYMQSGDYYPDDFVYTDVNGDKQNNDILYILK